MTLVILIGLWIPGEYALRQPSVIDRLPAPSYGSYSRFLDLKLAALARIVDEQGPIDCVFLGSSAVDRAIDIAVFEQTYQEITGEPIQCFNFGFVGGRDSAGLILAKILTDEYHPRLLVFGLSPHILNSSDEPPLVDDVWVRYRLGDYSFRGWLIDHSAVFRYGLLASRRWLNDEPLHVLEEWHYLVDWQGQIKMGGQITYPLTPEMQSFLAEVDYRMQPKGIERLQQMLAFHRPPNQMVVLVEIPRHPVVFEGYPDKLEDYGHAVDQIEQIANEKGVLFWPTMFHEAINQDIYWTDHAHMNKTGGAVFSQWLGEQIGEAVNQGQLADPTAPLLQLP